jgi:spermidine synthase
MDEWIEKKTIVFDGIDTEFGFMQVVDGYYLDEYMRFLLVDGAMQSAVYLHDNAGDALPFEYMQEFDWVYRINPQIKSALLIGGGAFAYPRYYFRKFPQNRKTVCEISETVIRLAKEYFGLDALMTEAGDRLSVYAKDGKRYMEETEEKFDLILNDAYIGGASSESMKSQAELIHKHLTNDGVYAANMVMALEGDASLAGRQEMETFAEVFRYTFLLPCDDELDPEEQQNCIFFASDHPLIPEG